jgi:hypothetical protein
MGGDLTYDYEAGMVAFKIQLRPAPQEPKSDDISTRKDNAIAS